MLEILQKRGVNAVLRLQMLPLRLPDTRGIHGRGGEVVELGRKSLLVAGGFAEDESRVAGLLVAKAAINAHLARQADDEEGNVAQVPNAAVEFSGVLGSWCIRNADRRARRESWLFSAGSLENVDALDAEIVFGPPIVGLLFLGEPEQLSGLRLELLGGRAKPR